MRLSFLLGALALVGCTAGGAKAPSNVHTWQGDVGGRVQVRSYDLPDCPRLQAARRESIPTNISWTSSSGQTVTLAYTGATVPPLTTFTRTPYRLNDMQIYLLSDSEIESPNTLYLLRDGRPAAAYVYRDPMAFPGTAPNKCKPAILIPSTQASN